MVVNCRKTLLSSLHSQTMIDLPAGPEATDAAGGWEATPPASVPVEAGTAVSSQGPREVEHRARQPTVDVRSHDPSQAQGGR